MEEKNQIKFIEQEKARIKFNEQIKKLEEDYIILKNKIVVEYENKLKEIKINYGK
jgi:hypothetical protein